ncbi:hypothetical protein BV898_02078 [Hypsibius exemplaris]|uniref:Uncharacterized protein n=1 Tax=Hypsibius exemplaris TaxID=2072580 RepID=A0A1W0X9B9_HYPEX|nr:hypothetical protein BV898_02078 [Hypsibius exemplaris]
MSFNRATLLGCFVVLTILSSHSVKVVEGTLGVSRHCTWHGTAPFCWPSCPMGKTSRMESKCGKNKLLCCISGNKKLCCPIGLDISPEMAAAIAQ